MCKKTHSFLKGKINQQFIMLNWKIFILKFIIMRTEFKFFLWILIRTAFLLNQFNISLLLPYMLFALFNIFYNPRPIRSARESFPKGLCVMLNLFQALRSYVLWNLRQSLPSVFFAALNKSIEFGFIPFLKPLGKQFFLLCVFLNGEIKLLTLGRFSFMDNFFLCLLQQQFINSILIEEELMIVKFRNLGFGLISWLDCLDISVIKSGEIG